MQVDEFNALTAEAATAMVRPCADIGRWVEGVVAERPYADLDTLLDFADELARGWSGAEVEEAIADHPRIGERHQGGGSSAAMSEREQGGLDQRDSDVQQRLLAGNVAYEERFGRIYLVRAAGRSVEEILSLLEERLGNDPTTELEVTAGQLREIAVLRLEGLLT